MTKYRREVERNASATSGDMDVDKPLRYAREHGAAADANRRVEQIGGRHQQFDKQRSEIQRRVARVKRDVTAVVYVGIANV